jgi:hypothetical protein
MLKFFTNLPDSLEQYNPEVIPKEWHREETFDKEGRLHSFDDLPMLTKNKNAAMSYSYNSGLNIYEFCWYNHGKLYRSGNRPAIIRVSENFYKTYNSQGSFHSYNGMPATFHALEDGVFSLDWYADGKNHRDGDDLPLSIIVDSTGYLEHESYGLHGILHRGNNLPAETNFDTQTWIVQGRMHNSEGYAQLFYPDDYTWALYGLEVSESIFNQIKTMPATANLPIWVSFLRTLDIISQEQVNAFISSDGKWDTNIPNSWLLNCWNVTSIFFEKKITRLAKRGIVSVFYTDKNESLYSAFLAVIKSEENDALLRVSQGEKSYV